MNDDVFDLTELAIQCDGCQDPSGRWRAGLKGFWCDVCVRQLATYLGIGL